MEEVNLCGEGQGTAVNMFELTRPLGRMAAKERKGRKNRGFSATGRPLGVMTERLAVSSTAHGPGCLPALLRPLRSFVAILLRVGFSKTL